MTSSDLTPGALVLRLANTSGAVVAGLDLVATVYVRNDGDRSTTLVAEWAEELGGPWQPFTAALTTPAAAAAAPTWSPAPLAGATAPGVAVEPGEEVLVRFALDDGRGSGERDELALAAMAPHPGVTLRLPSRRLPVYTRHQ